LVLSTVTVWSCSPAGQDSKVTGPGTGSNPATGGSGGGVIPGAGTTGKGGPDLGMLPPDPGENGPCRGLECQVQTCAAGTDTTITGKVYAPNGTLALYNVVVYVPNDPVPAFTEGASCDRCGASIVDPVTASVTDETGTFVLKRAPAGANIPLVIQVGKWRRQITLPNVAPCVDTPLTDPQLTRLPKNKAEGDLPRIAIQAGGADAMECLPRRLGIDDAEFTTNAGDGRIHLYTATDNANDQGVGDLSVKAFAPTLNGGVALPHGQTLWQDQATLMKYDIVILSCEGAGFAMEKPMAARQALYDYASQGGRVFASHWHHVWFSQGPDPLPTTGTWQARENPAEASASLPATINQTFPKGEALAKWLVNVGASTVQGTLDVIGPRDNVQEVNPMTSREWITLDNPNATPAKTVEYMSFNTPVGVPEAEACGRVVYTGLHVSNSVEDRTEQPPGFPGLCEMSELTAQEKAVAFMLFDLSACIQNEDEPPKPPK
jgi:hypothetical protein